MNGRLVQWGGDRGAVATELGVFEFHWPAGKATARVGDIVGVAGIVRDGALVGSELRVLAPAAGHPDPAEVSLEDARATRRRGILALRSRAVAAVRSFFTSRHFLEVETPILASAPGQDAHVELFETEFRDGARRRGLYLLSSPEHCMKRLLGDGCERIFQISRCFRNGERSPTHNPEFSLVEWYRAYASYEEVIADVEDIVRCVAVAVAGAPVVGWRGLRVDLDAGWNHLTVDEAFLELADVDLRRCAAVEALRRRAREVGCASVTDDDGWDDAFYKLLIERVEPGIAARGAVVLRDYPASMAALAKLKASDPERAERAEAYVGGLELANGFTELNDPREQRARFVAERERRRSLGLSPYPLDEEFLSMLSRGMPPAGGMALGLDRLLMLVQEAATIDEVLTFPCPS